MFQLPKSAEITKQKTPVEKSLIANSSLSHITIRENSQEDIDNEIKNLKITKQNSSNRKGDLSMASKVSNKKFTRRSTMVHKKSMHMDMLTLNNKNSHE